MVQRNIDRVKTLTRVFIAAATILSLVFYIPAELFPGKVLSMFITTPGVAVSGGNEFPYYVQHLYSSGKFSDCCDIVPVFGQSQ